QTQTPLSGASRAAQVPRGSGEILARGMPALCWLSSDASRWQSTVRMAMTDTMIGRIHPGASVATPEGRLGRVERVGPDSIEVMVEATRRRVSVPRASISRVGTDGSVHLSITRAEIQRLVAGGRLGE